MNRIEVLIQIANIAEILPLNYNNQSIFKLDKVKE